MLAITQLFLAITASRIGNLRHWAGERITYMAWLAFFGVITFVFALVTITVALAHWVGALWALAIMTGAGLSGCLVVWGVKRTSDRRHRRRARQKADMQSRLTQLAMLTTMRRTRRLRVPIALALAAGTFALVVSRLAGEEDED